MLDTFVEYLGKQLYMKCRMKIKKLYYIGIQDFTGSAVSLLTAKLFTNDQLNERNFSHLIDGLKDVKIILEFL